MSLRILLYSILFMSVTALPAWGVELSPFQTRNFSPTAMIHGLSVAETPFLLAKGKTSLQTSFDLANLASSNTGSDNKILLDGETYITTIGLRYGLGKNLQVGIDLPWVQHSEGSLDDFIGNWHNFFGLPNGDRDSLPNDQLNYRYTSNDIDKFHLQRETEGVGDLRLLLAWQFLTAEQSAFTLQTQIKTPTGHANKLTGSEAWDISLALSTQRNFNLSNGRGAIWGGIGASWLGNGQVLENEIKDYAATGWIGAGWAPLDWLALKLQVDSHTALYDNNLEELGGQAVMLTIGGTLALGEKTLLDIGVGEDLNVNASPDVNFHFRLGHTF